MRIRFTREYVVQDDTGTRYAVGEEITVNAASARHFIDRGAAVEVPAKRRAPRKAAKVDPERTDEQAGLQQALDDAAQA